MAPSAADTQTLVASIRAEIRALEYEPLDDQMLAETHATTEDAVADAASEGVYRTPRLAALHKMLVQERAPQEVRDLAVRRFMEAVATATAADR